jgi:DNA polymerase-3 subunit beta
MPATQAEEVLMEIKLTRDALSRAVTQVWHIADRRSTMRILSCVLFKASGEGSRLKLASSNIRNTVQYDLNAEVDGDVGFAIPAKTINDVVRILPESDVTITATDDDKVKISSGSYNARVPILPEEEFPSLPDVGKVEEKDRYSLSAARLKRLIERTNFSISDDETRPYLNGALFESTGDFVKMVTTDGHRMTVHGEPIGEGESAGELKLLVPQLGVQELKRFLDLGEDITVMSVDGSNVHFLKGLEGGDETIVLTVRLTESEFPPYESVIPRSNDKSVTCNRQALFDAIRRVSVMTSERHRAVHLSLVGNDMNIRADNPELGEAEEAVGVAYEGENLVIGFNANYLVNVLSAMDAEQVEMRFGGGLDGAIFKVPDSEDFLGIVMPIRI